MSNFVKPALASATLFALGVAAWAEPGHAPKQTGIQLGGHTFAAQAAHSAGRKETSHADLKGEHHVGTFAHAKGKTATVHLLAKPGLCDTDSECAAGHAIEVRAGKTVAAGQNVKVSTRKGTKGVKHVAHAEVGASRDSCDVFVHIHFRYPLAFDADGCPIYADIDFDMPLGDFLVLFGLAS